MQNLNIMNLLIKYISLSFHLFFSFSLLFIGEYTLALIFQSIFFTYFIKSKIVLYLFFMPIVLFGLTKLFASLYYLLYFLNLSFFLYFLYFLYESKKIIAVKYLIIFLLYGILITFLYIRFEELRYDIYLYMEINDRINSINNEVVIALNFLHLFILFLMGYNNRVG